MYELALTSEQVPGLRVIICVFYFVKLAPVRGFEMHATHMVISLL